MKDQGKMMYESNQKNTTHSSEKIEKVLYINKLNYLLCSVLLLFLLIS